MGKWLDGRKAWLRRTGSRLVGRYRTVAVFSAALEDFHRNGLWLNNYYFTVNAFMGVLAMFVAVSSLMGFLAESEVKRQLVEGMKVVMPVLRGPADETVNVFESFRGTAGLISLLFLLWAATRIFSALERGFDIVWKQDKRRYARTLFTGLFMVMLTGSLFLLTLVVQFGFNGLWEELFESRGAGYYLGVSLAKPVIGMVMGFLMFMFIYRVVTGVRPRMKSCAAAAALAAALFLGSQYLLNLYFDTLYKVPVIYGSLASGIIVVLWMQWTGLITFFGAELIYMLDNPDRVGEYADRRRAEE